MNKPGSVFRIAPAVALCVLLLTTTAAAASTTIRYVGSSTVAQFISQADAAYPDADFSVYTKPESEGGENAAAHGKTQLAGVARELRPNILETGVRVHRIGYDAIAVWVHPNNPVRDLSLAQLAGIFSGKIADWSEVGGPEGPIRVYLVAPNSATRKAFADRVMGTARYGGQARTVRPDSAVLTRVSEDPRGIGALSLALAPKGEDREQVAVVAVEGRIPGPETVNYPIRRPLHLVTPGRPTAEVTRFIQWALSPEGQAVVARSFLTR